MKLPLGPAAVYALVRELRAEAQGERPLAVGGARELAAALRRELVRDGDPGAVVESGRFEDVAALVFILAGPPTEDDQRILRSADRAGTPIVCLAPPEVAAAPIPYVLATDVVQIPPGSGFPLDELAGALAGHYIAARENASDEPQRSALAAYYLDEFTPRELRQLLDLKAGEISKFVTDGRRQFQAWLNATTPVDVYDDA